MIQWRPVKHGSTDQSVVIRILDSSTGLPETGVEHNTSGIDLEYRRDGAVSTDITEAALAAQDSAHSDGGIEHLGNGYYRVDVPDAAFAAGVSGVLIHGTVTDMVVDGCYVPLVPYDPYADTIGALDVSAATGDPGTDVTALGYLKQLVNILIGSSGVATFPAAAVAANGVSLAEVLRSIDTRLLTALNNGVIPADVQRINNVEITGDGGDSPFDVA